MRLTEAAVYFALAKRIGIKLSDELESILSSYNQAEAFASELARAMDNRYCVISESGDAFDLVKDLCLVKALALLGKRADHIIIDQSKVWINNYFAKGNGAVKQIEGAVSSAHPIDIIFELCERVQSGKPIILFGNSDFLMGINENLKVRKRLEMYYRHYEKLPIRQMDCLLLGFYFTSLSHLWGYDVEKEFKQHPQYDFTVIIPVRNSVKYLRETIETCLDQDYSGTYEVLISDNGWHQDVDIHRIIDEVNDDRVRYIKAPFDLNLPKSFEFAYLNSRGKYLISIGADDGLLRNALTFV
ncbi:MAG: glycosyltransferase, partial [Bacillota bacterium]